MNPYPSRPYPVGKTSYQLASEGFQAVNKVRHLAMLEYGEAELLYDIPRLIGENIEPPCVCCNCEDLEIANLGHAMGGSALLLANGAADSGIRAAVTSVDTFKSKNQQSKFEEASRVVAEHQRDASLIQLYRGTTDEVAAEFAKTITLFFDFIFVDADHSYEGVKKDFLNWSPMLRHGGWIAFHDTNQEFSRKVLDEYLIDKPDWVEHLELHVNRIRVFEKQ